MASAVPSISGVFSDTGVPDLKLPACIYGAAAGIQERRVVPDDRKRGMNAGMVLRCIHMAGSLCRNCAAHADG